MAESATYEAVKRTKRKTKQLLIPFGTHSRFGTEYIFDSFKANNGHMIVSGPSGSGKSHQLNRIVLTLAEQGANLFVVDTQGDIGDFTDLAPFRKNPIPESIVHTINFGEQTRYGLPPLDLIDDGHNSPRKRSNAFIELLQRQGALGPKQKTALFRLLIDLYKQHGFSDDDPKTWSLNYDPRRNKTKAVTPREGMVALPGLNWFDKSEEEKKVLKQDYSVKFNGVGDVKFWEMPEDHPLVAEATEKWGISDAKRFPTLSDVRRHLWDRLVMMKTGQTAPAIRALDKVMNLAQKRSRLRTRKLTEAGQEDLDKLEALLGKAQQESIDAFTDGMEKIDSGLELEELLLWDSADAIKGLFDRIEALERSGIFKGEPPPFDEQVPIWRYNISKMDNSEQALFGDVLLERIFAEAKSRGEADGPDTFILIDEAHKFVSADSTHVINRLVKESRKFGIGLILASQSFIHFSDDLLMSSGLKLVLECPELHKEQMRRQLSLDMITLKSGKKVNPLSLIRPKETAMLSMATSGGTFPMSDINIVAA